MANDTADPTTVTMTAAQFAAFDRIGSIVPMLGIMTSALYIDEAAALKDGATLQLALIVKRKDGSGRVGPSWDAQEFLKDLATVYGDRDA